MGKLVRRVLCGLITNWLYYTVCMYCVVECMCTYVHTHVHVHVHVHDIERGCDITCAVL